MKARGEGVSLAPTDVAHHLACQHRTQLERKRLAGELGEVFRPDARLEAMKQRGQEHERTYIDTLRAQGLQVADLSDSRDPAATRAAMHAGVDVIVQAPLGNDTFFGIADVLLRVATPSAFASYSYEPVDTKLAAETKAGSLLQLLTYCELLHGMQGTVPAEFHVVTPAKPERYRTADYAAYFRVIQDHLRSAVAATPPPATYPEPVPHCDVCAYWQHCDQRRRDDDHLSLIADIRRPHVKELERQGLPTLAAFATAGTLPAAPERGRPETYGRLAHQARLQLQARTTGHVPVDPLPIEPGRGLCRLPAPSPGDVLLDFEGDPFVGQGGLEYLTGYSYQEADGTHVYKALWALDHPAEKQALETFLDFLAARLRAHPNLHVYHFGAYEQAALRRLCARHDTRGAVLDEFLRGQRFVNLHTLVRESVRIGIEGYGLKELEKVIGYPRQFDLRVAGQARRDLELHLELGRRNQITDTLREQVAAYNRDDCLATAHLRDWLEQQRADRITSGQTIPRPAVGATEPPAEVRANEARIAALREALTRDLPAPEDRNDEQRAKALLGDLVGYFLRERKSAWWETYRLRELPPEEHMDERAMLAGLVHVRTLKRQGRQEHDRYVFRFPVQETGVKDDDNLMCTALEDVHPEGKMTSGSIDELDLESGEITIALPDHAAHRLPTAMFSKPFIPPDSVENSIVQLGERVRDHGLAGNQRDPALDLLMRRSPRLRQPSPMRQPGEDAPAALLRLCRALDGGVLPVQGPPGTGKTYTGATAIAGLVADGKKVGVVAVSHKVIDNLLAAVSNVKGPKPVRVLHVDKAPDDRVPRAKNEKAAIADLSRGTVVGGTAYFWVKLQESEKLDYLFVDEAGQMSLAQVLAFARAARNLVLLGDPQQLEQPHKGTHPDGADVAALTHLIGTDRATLAGDQGLFLAETWRLHPSICAFTSELYYDGKLTAVAGCDRQRIDGTGLVDGAGMFLLEVDHAGNQASSSEECDAIARLIRPLLKAGSTWTDRHGDVHPLTPDDVLVIAPYNAQVGALRRALAPLGVTKVGTVDKFQGQEAPIVLYSCTSSSPEDAPRGLAFLYDPHRLNVATSRARCAFVMVASPALFAPEVRTPEQMRWANGMCRFREVATHIRVDPAG